MSRSIRLNERTWKVNQLGERALLFQTEPGADTLASVHQLYRFLEQQVNRDIEDVVPAYESLAVIFKKELPDVTLFLSRIVNAFEEEPKAQVPEANKHRVPICYELGADWDEVCTHTGLSKEEVIKRHQANSYTLAMMGFIPGFVFLEGLEQDLHCPRRSTPRQQVPAGSVGIGGSQTGIYSMESPGGWQIIGRTPLHFFDASKEPPTELNPGDRITFYPITAKEYEEWNHG